MDSYYGGGFCWLSECVKSLLERGADVNIKNSVGQTTLLVASEYAHSDCVSLLIKEDTDLSSADSHGRTALIWAANNGHVGNMEALVINGANVNHADDDGWTALMIAAFTGQSKCLEMLLEAEADVNLKAMWYKTDPEYAAVRCTKALLNSVHMSARNGCTALMPSSTGGMQ